MRKINIPINRERAKLWFEESKDSLWKLKVDKKHIYCLEYIRICFDDDKSIKFIDPSGGPMISVGDEFENGKFIIDKIINSTTFLISERNNN